MTSFTLSITSQSGVGTGKPILTPNLSGSNNSSLGVTPSPLPHDPNKVDRAAKPHITHTPSNTTHKISLHQRSSSSSSSASSEAETPTPIEDEEDENDSMPNPQSLYNDSNNINESHPNAFNAQILCLKPGDSSSHLLKNPASLLELEKELTQTSTSTLNQPSKLNLPLANSSSNHSSNQSPTPNESLYNSSPEASQPPRTIPQLSSLTVPFHLNSCAKGNPPKKITLSDQPSSSNESILSKASSSHKNESPTPDGDGELILLEYGSDEKEKFKSSKEIQQTNKETQVQKLIDDLWQRQVEDLPEITKMRYGLRAVTGVS
jgi:hypothetical protein